MDYNHGAVFLGDPRVDFDTGNDVYFKNSFIEHATTFTTKV